MPNHVKKYDKSRYRGVVTKNIKKTDGEVCLVNVGLDVDIKLDKILPEGTRVTVEMEGKFTSISHLCFDITFKRTTSFLVLYIYLCAILYLGKDYMAWY